jgi:hypothetical protein
LTRDIDGVIHILHLIYLVSLVGTLVSTQRDKHILNRNFTLLFMHMVCPDLIALIGTLSKVTHCGYSLTRHGTFHISTRYGLRLALVILNIFGSSEFWTFLIDTYTSVRIRFFVSLVLVREQGLTSRIERLLTRRLNEKLGLRRLLPDSFL